jgi:ribose transport system permease protein
VIVLRRLENSDVTRPVLVLSVVFVALLGMAMFTGTPLDGRLAYSVLQYFATLGPVALGLGLTMIAREYDLSVGSTLGLAGCVAVIAGAGNPYLGLLCGVGVGLVIGLVQGALIVGLRMSSIPVTLGGLMTIGAVSYVITGNQTITYPDLDVAMAVNTPIFGILSERSVIAVACFVIAAIIVTYTRIGRDLSASGSDRKAATTAGVRTSAVLVLVFMTSGGLSAFSGVLLSYSLAAASPVGLTDILVPATAASPFPGVAAIPWASRRVS